ncbi:SpaA isopeptide-forming pilin-related protein [Methanobrevibacter sp.]|uniref:SpaA isopeptide-forming pilin-related protein n=1 Tax=Methanobrevibacter sp. TaxID=66852 RepID=UPI00388D2FC2
MKKTNKTFKRFAAITSASLLAACAVAPVAFNAFAVKVTIDSSVDNDGYDADKATHTYTAYPIFAGEFTDEGLTINGWGTGFDSASLLANETFKALVVEPAVPEDPDTPEIEAKDAVTFADFISGKANDDLAAVTAQAIEKMIALDSITADGLADILAQYVSANGTPIAANTDLSQGYYLVKDTYTVGTDTATNDALSKFILKVAGNEDIVITPKKSYPTVIKKVKEDNSNNTIADYPEGATALENAVDHTTGWNDVGDFCIGEEIDFMLYGSVPATIDDYTNGYKYVFNDKMSSNLEYIDAGNDGKPDVTVYIGDTEVDSDDYIVSDIVDNSFSVTFNNLKEISDEEDNPITVDGSSIVKVAYKAKLTSNAEPGKNGETNEVYLEYSNNPEWSGEASNNTVDKTIVDKVVVFTYELDVTKVDGATKKKLEGASFQLYKVVKETENSVEVDNRYYAKATNGVFAGWVKATKAGDDYTVPADAATFTSNADGLFTLKGIDEGTYYLSETNPPQGYNALPGDKKLTITAETANEQDEVADGSELQSLSITVDSVNTPGNVTDGSVSMSVENNKGTELPGTGGIGTTIFYLGGGAMAAIGGIYLISKRRMRKSEE